MLKRIYNNAMQALGRGSLFLVAFSTIWSRFEVSFLYFAAAFAILVSTWEAVLFFGARLSYRQLWFRRAIYLIGMISLVIILSMIFLLNTPPSPKRIAHLFLTILVTELVITIPLYFISDYMEKRALKKINEKLGENQ